MKRLFLLFVVCGLLISCDPYENPLDHGSTDNEILIYSGYTMSDAVFEFKDIYEASTGCKLSVMYGASGYLQRVIEVNKVGDIFFPGNKSYLDHFKKNNIVSRTIDVGFNKLSLFVVKGNPLYLNGSLEQLKEKRLRVAIGMKEAGAVGDETAKLLEKHGIYDAVSTNVSSFTTDSKGLALALREDNADVVINWYATGFSNKNIHLLEPIKIDSPYIEEVPIAMGLLKYSSNTVCANKFLDMASSEKGVEIFKKYGFKDK